MGKQNTPRAINTEEKDYIKHMHEDTQSDLKTQRRPSSTSTQVLQGWTMEERIRSNNRFHLAKLDLTRQSIRHNYSQEAESDLDSK